MIYAFENTNHYAVESGPGEPEPRSDTTTHLIYHPDVLMLMRFFEDIKNTYDDFIRAHPNRLQHVTGLAHIPVDFTKFLDKMTQKCGYRHISPNCSFIFIEGYDADEYPDDRLNGITAPGLLIEFASSYPVHPSLHIYEVIKGNKCSINHEADDYTVIEYSNWHLTHEILFTQEQYYDHIDTVYRKLMIQCKHVYTEEVIMELCAVYGYRSLVFDLHFTMFEGSPDIDDHYAGEAKEGITSEMDMKYLHQNISSFINEDFTWHVHFMNVSLRNKTK